MASSEYLIDLDFRLAYGPLDDRLNGLYLPALARSVRYDLSAGLFSTAALAIAARGVDALIRNRGHMRLLIGAGIADGAPGDIRNEQGLQNILRDQFLSLLSVTDLRVSRRLELLGWMAAEKTIEIRVAMPLKDARDPAGAIAMAHDLPRLGIFTDAEGNQVGFFGNISESSGAGDQSYEHLVVSKSWEHGGLYLQVIRQHFERLWEGKEAGWQCLAMPGAIIDRLIEYCPRKMPVHGRRVAQSAGKPDLPPKIRKIIYDQYIQDMKYFTPDDPGRPPDENRSGAKGAPQGLPVLENPESCRLPLMRMEVETPEPLVAYYHLLADRIEPLRSITQLEAVFHDPIRGEVPPPASEINAREHFHALLKACEDSRVRERQAARQQQRLALARAGHRVLVKAALCDIAKSRHATLFDEDLIAADFDTATVLRQGKKGLPFSELISWIQPMECPGPDMRDSFWGEIEGKSQKQIQGIEKALKEEGQALIRAWAELSGKTAVERDFPTIAVRRYFIRNQKEKPRLVLVIAPARRERFTRYLPFYSMASAFDRFIRGRDAAEEGWMEVEIGEKLNKSMFIMRIDSQAMEPLIPDGHFAVFDSDIKGSPDGAVLFVYGKDIYDPNHSSHLTVRRLKVISGPKTGEYQDIILEPLHPDYQRFQLKNPEKGDFKIIARFVCGI